MKVVSRLWRRGPRLRWTHRPDRLIIPWGRPCDHHLRRRANMPRPFPYVLLAAWLCLPLLHAQQPDPKKDPPKEKQSKKVDDAWIKQVQKLPADKQVVAVIGKLKELNPGFDGKLSHKIENGAVTELHFVSD